MKPKIFSNAILGSGIPNAPTFVLHQTVSQSERIYRMNRPGSWWLMIRPASTWPTEVLAIEVRVNGPSDSRLIQQYRYIQRRHFIPRIYIWVRDPLLDAGNVRFARPNGSIPTTGFYISETIMLGNNNNQNFPYRTANSFGPFYIHSYLVPDNSAHPYCQLNPPALNVIPFDLPEIAPGSPPVYRTPETTRIGDEPRQMLHAWFTLGEGESCDVRVCGFNHDVSRIPGFTETIPDTCDPAADEVPANWIDDGLAQLAHRPTFFILPVTL